MRAVLADTGPLYAALDPDDAYHEQAQRELSRLASDRLAVIVLFPILCESHSLALRRLSVQATQEWLTEILAGAVLLNPTSGDYHAAAATVQRYADQAVTLFDAVLATVSGRLEVAIWTYDHHFDVLLADVWR